MHGEASGSAGWFSVRAVPAVEGQFGVKILLSGVQDDALVFMGFGSQTPFSASGVRGNRASLREFPE